MKFSRRAAARADADQSYGMPDPSPHGNGKINGGGIGDAEQMTIDALRRDLLEESILQEVIAAELAERQELEAEFRRRELGLYRDMPPPHIRAGFKPITSPARHGEPLDAMPRRPVKDRIKEWYRPPWHESRYRAANEENGYPDEDRLHIKAFSGVKRKRTAETPLWICSICKVKCTRESDLLNHLGGRRHQKNIKALKREGKEIEAKLYAKKVPQFAEKNPKPVSRWKCNICKAEGKEIESDLLNHLGGRRHQKNIKALKREGKEIEAKLYAKKVPQFAEKNPKPVSRWKCNICKANCSSEHDLENHLRGRRHQKNIQAQYLEGRSTPTECTCPVLRGQEYKSGNAQCTELRCSC